MFCIGTAGNKRIGLSISTDTNAIGGKRINLAITEDSILIGDWKIWANEKNSRSGKKL